MPYIRTVKPIGPCEAGIMQALEDNPTYYAKWVNGKYVITNERVRVHREVCDEYFTRELGRGKK